MRNTIVWERSRGEVGFGMYTHCWFEGGREGMPHEEDLYVQSYYWIGQWGNIKKYGNNNVISYTESGEGVSIRLRCASIRKFLVLDGERSCIQNKVEAAGIIIS